MKSKERGDWAEQAAAADLERRGFRILGRNLHMHRGELDLVAQRGSRLWFVECKCRGRSDRGAPHRAIDRAKRSALFAAAREFVVRQGYHGDYGFLVASIVPDAQDGRPLIAWSKLPIGPSDWLPEGRRPRGGPRS